MSRYALQMSEFQAYRVALYDTQLGKVVAQFKFDDVGELVCAYLNKLETLNG